MDHHKQHHHHHRHSSGSMNLSTTGPPSLGTRSSTGPPSFGALNHGSSSTRSLESPGFVSPASEAPAVAAAAPKDESLYESLLRYHEEHDDDDEEQDVVKKKAPRKTAYDNEDDDGNVDDRKLPANLKSADSFDDRKPPAKPAAASHHPPLKKKPTPTQSSTATNTPMPATTSSRPLPHSSFPIPSNDSDEPRIKQFSSQHRVPPAPSSSSPGGNNGSSPRGRGGPSAAAEAAVADRNRGSFYQAAIEESRLMGVGGTGNARDEQPKSITKPGAVRVNEPVAGPGSTVYRQAFGEQTPRVAVAQNLNRNALGVNETRAMLEALSKSRKAPKGNNMVGEQPPRVPMAQNRNVSKFTEPLGIDETRAMIDALSQTKKVSKPREIMDVEEYLDGIFSEDLGPQSQSNSRSASPVLPKAVGRKSPGETLGRKSPGATNLSGHGPSNPSRGPEPNYTTRDRSPRGRSPGQARHSDNGPSSKLLPKSGYPQKNKSSPSRMEEFDNLGRVNSGFDVMERTTFSPPLRGRDSRHKPSKSKSPSPPKSPYEYPRGYKTQTGRSTSPNTRHSAVVEPSRSDYGGFFEKFSGRSRSPRPPDRHHRPYGRPHSPPLQPNSQSPSLAAPKRHHSSASARTADVDPDLDEDLLLALELSKKDTGQPSSELTDDTRYPSSLPASSYTSAIPVSSAPSKQNYARDDPNHGSVQDLILALHLSEELSEETLKGDSHSPFNSSSRRRISTSLEELLELESSGFTGLDNSEERLVTDFVAAGISTDKTSRPDEQFRILEQIREAQEQKELEQALKVSQEQPASPAFNMKDQARDFLLSQQKAMEEWSKSTDDDDSKQSPRGRKNSVASQDSTERRRELVQRGTAETQEAITSGQAHIVTCRGCQGRLQAPVSYSLVFCPKCQTISPA